MKAYDFTLCLGVFVVQSCLVSALPDWGNAGHNHKNAFFGNQTHRVSGWGFLDSINIGVVDDSL